MFTPKLQNTGMLDVFTLALSDASGMLDSLHMLDLAVVYYERRVCWKVIELAAGQSVEEQLAQSQSQAGKAVRGRDLSAQLHTQLGQLLVINSSVCSSRCLFFVCSFLRFLITTVRYILT